MKKLVMLLVTLMVCAVMTATPVMAGGPNGAEKETLYLFPAWNCEDGATPNDAIYGFAVISINGNDEVIVEASLKGAVPNATFDIYVYQWNGGCNSTLFAGALTTNGQGNGNGHVNVDKIDDATKFHVTVRSAHGNYRSPAAERD